MIGGSVPAGPTTQGDGDHPFLQRQHLGRRPPPVGYLDDEGTGQEGLRPLLDLGQLGAVGCGGGHRPHRLGRVEGGVVQGDATGEGLVGGQGGEQSSRRTGDGGRVEAELLRLLSPSDAQVQLGDRVVLGLAGGQGGDLGRPRPGRALLAHVLGDGGPALAEPGPHLGRDADDVAGAVSRQLEAHPQPLDQAPTQEGLVDGRGRLGVGEQAGAVDAGPPAVGPGGGVGDQDVGVQLGVAGPAGVVDEGGRHHPPARLEAHPFAVDASPAHPAGVGLQVLDGSCHRRVVGGDHRPHVVAVAQGEQDRDRLGGGEGGVVAGAEHPAVAQVTAVGPAPGEQGPQVVGIDGPRQAERLGAAPQPAAGHLAPAQVVLLGAEGDGLDVVAGRVRRSQREDAQHVELGPQRPRNLASRGAGRPVAPLGVPGCARSAGRFRRWWRAVRRPGRVRVGPSGCGRSRSVAREIWRSSMA